MNEIVPTVCIVDDDPAVRDSLRWLLLAENLNVETYASAREFEDNYDPSKPGCLVLDIRMPGMSGLDLYDRLVARGSGLPVIIITGHGDVPSAVRAMRRGAVDFIEKPFDDVVLVDRIRQAIERDTVNRRDEARRASVSARLSSLTPREREVLGLVVAGYANKQVAAHLCLSPKTIEIHRANVMKKMRVDSLAQLVQIVEQARADPGKPRSF